MSVVFQCVLWLLGIGLLGALSPWWGAARPRSIVGPTLAGIAMTTGIARLLGISWPALFFLAVLIIVAAIDWDERIIPNRWVIGLLALGIYLHSLEGHWLNAVLTAGGTGLFFGLAHVLTRGGLGFGDVKLALAEAWILGYPAIVLGLTVGLMAAAVVSLGLLAFRRVTVKSTIPFGPFLALGGLVGLLAIRPF